ncbi:MAG: type II toxin-antitoxin system VapC family toxin [Thermoproteota archaeon]
MKLYLDSSVIVKRYVSESDSSIVDYVFDKSWAGELSLATSIWNIGEVFGVLDERRRKGWLNENEFAKSLENFASETVRLLHLKTLEVFTILNPIIVKTWPLILREHVYEADALQIQTCIYSGSNALLSGDRKLINVAIKAGLKAVKHKRRRES